MKQTKQNKIGRVSLAGGLIGWLLTNPRRALDSRLAKENKEGWNAIHIDPHRETNMLVFLLSLVVLACTLGLWTWGAGYLVLFERDLET